MEMDLFLLLAVVYTYICEMDFSSTALSSDLDRIIMNHFRSSCLQHTGINVREIEKCK